MTVPALLKSAQSDDIRFFLQFGGQAAPWLRELQKLYRQSKTIETLVDYCLDALEMEYATLGRTLALPDGFQVRSWLKGECAPPDDDYLFLSAVSMPMIHVTQLAHLENLYANGWPQDELQRFCSGSTGHSQGLVTAILPALVLTRAEYIRMAVHWTKYFFYLGVRSQEAFPYPRPNESELNLAKELGFKEKPSPMAALLGPKSDEVQSAVDELNNTLSEDEKIYISLYNSPTNHIISAPRKSILNFYAKNREWLEYAGHKFMLLKSSCPFHSPLMNEFMSGSFLDDLNRLGFPALGIRLRFPVISFADGRNLQHERRELGMVLAEEITVRPLYWEKAIGAFIDSNDISYIDLGVGKGVKRLTQDIFNIHGKDSQINSAAVAADFKQLIQ